MAGAAERRAPRGRPAAAAGMGVSARLGVLRVLYQRRRRAERGRTTRRRRRCGWRALRIRFDGRRALLSPCSPWPRRWRPWQAIVLAEPRIRRAQRADRRPASWPPPTLTAASTPLHVRDAVADPVAERRALRQRRPWPRALGSALLWAMWGEYYAVIPRDRSELLVPVSAVSAADHRSSGVRHGRLGAHSRRLGAAASVRTVFLARVDTRGGPRRERVGVRCPIGDRRNGSAPPGRPRAHGFRHSRRVRHREHRRHDGRRLRVRCAPPGHPGVQRPHDGRGSNHGRIGPEAHLAVLPLPVALPHSRHRLRRRHPLRPGRRPRRRRPRPSEAASRSASLRRSISQTTPAPVAPRPPRHPAWGGCSFMRAT